MIEATNTNAMGDALAPRRPALPFHGLTGEHGDAMAYAAECYIDRRRIGYADRVVDVCERYEHARLDAEQRRLLPIVGRLLGFAVPIVAMGWDFKPIEPWVCYSSKSNPFGTGCDREGQPS